MKEPLLFCGNTLSAAIVYIYKCLQPHLPVRSLDTLRMLACVALLCVLGRLVLGQEAFYENYAYTKAMSQCLGERLYLDYLQKVAAARRQCVREGAGVIGDSSIFPNTVFSTNPQGGGFFNQQPAVFPQQPVLFSQLPTLFPQQAGVFPQQSGVFSQQPTVLSQQPGVLSQQPGVFSQQPQVLLQQPGILSQQSGVNLPPETFSTFFPRNGLPLSSRVPNFRRKRALVLGPAEIQETMRKVNALIGNFTCVLGKLGVVNSQLDVNYDGLASNTFNLPIETSLKNDLTAVIDYCKDMTLCLPLENQQQQLSAVPHKLQRLMSFIRCEKAERLTACLKHELRRNMRQSDLGAPSQNLETLVSLLVTAESANELQLI